LFARAAACERLDDVEFKHAALVVENDAFLGDRVEYVRLVCTAVRLDMGSDGTRCHFKPLSSM